MMDMMKDDLVLFLMSRPEIDSKEELEALHEESSETHTHTHTMPEIHTFTQHWGEAESDVAVDTKSPASVYEK